MNFWEDFFSANKIIYPILMTIVFGLIIWFMILLVNLSINDNIMIGFMIIGFLLGNHIKIIKINNDRNN